MMERYFGESTLKLGFDLMRLPKTGGRASDCIACGQCEGACPQQLDVSARMKECAAQFD